MKLTIAIPTYNRNEILIKNLHLLLSQLTSDCNVIIVDNASPNPVESDVRNAFPCDLLKSVTFIRNRWNIGGDANIVRCLESSYGKWTWLLGDDDPVSPHAIKSILEDIEKDDSLTIGAICYSSDLSGPNKDDVISAGNVDKLFSSISYGSMLFISTKVFRNAAISDHFRSAYSACYANSSQSALLLSLFLNGHDIRLSKREIVKQEIPSDPSNKWSYIGLASRCTALEMAISGNSSSLNTKKIRSWIYDRKMFPMTRILAFLCLENLSEGRRKMARRYLMNGLFSNQTIGSLVFTMISIVPVYAPTMSRRILKMLLPNKFKTFNPNART